MMVLKLPSDMGNAIRIQPITELKNYLKLDVVFSKYLCLINIWILKFLVCMKMFLIFYSYAAFLLNARKSKLKKYVFQVLNGYDASVSEVI